MNNLQGGGGEITKYFTIDKDNTTNKYVLNYTDEKKSSDKTIFSYIKKESDLQNSDLYNENNDKNYILINSYNQNETEPYINCNISSNIQSEIKVYINYLSHNTNNGPIYRHSMVTIIPKGSGFFGSKKEFKNVLDIEIYAPELFNYIKEICLLSSFIDELKDIQSVIIKIKDTCQGISRCVLNIEDYNNFINFIYKTIDSWPTLSKNEKIKIINDFKKIKLENSKLLNHHIYKNIKSNMAGGSSISFNDYRYKYLKYKQKYLSLKTNK